MPQRSHTTAILAMSVDGKIADVRRSPARFASAADQAHLEQQISVVDGVLFGAGTLRAYGSSLAITNPQLLQARQNRGQPLQPIHVLCSTSGQIEAQWRFFRQPIPRWLVTTTAETEFTNTDWAQGFEQILTFSPLQTHYPAVSDDGNMAEQVNTIKLNWQDILARLWTLGLPKIAILGGGQLMASLIAQDLVDEFWITICPLILGGASAPTPVDGAGVTLPHGLPLQLVSSECVGQEIFLHYCRQR